MENRGAGSVMVDRGGVERDGVTVLSWQVRKLRNYSKQYVPLSLIHI